MSSSRIQEWFTKIVTGLAAQGWKQSRHPSTGACAYRGENGMACAIGQLIANDCPVVLFDYRKSVSALKDEKNLDWLGLGEITPEEFRFLDRAQVMHDQETIGPTVMKERFVGLADSFKLNFPPIQ